MQEVKANQESRTYSEENAGMRLHVGLKSCYFFRMKDLKVFAIETMYRKTGIISKVNLNCWGLNIYIYIYM